MSVLGIDVGGTKCLAFEITDNGSYGSKVTAPTAQGLGIVKQITEFAQSFSGLTSLGVGMPGIVTREGVVRLAPHLPAIRNLPLKQILEEALGLEVHIDNDATCAAVAEWQVGAASGCSDAIVVTLGTGIGSGIIANSTVVRGYHGFAGEVGHNVVVVDGELCPCGRRGCWEQYASGSALRRFAGGTSGEDVIARAATGNLEAIAILQTFSHWVALGLMNLIGAFDPQRIVLGGGLGSSPTLLPLVQKALHEMMPPEEFRPHAHVVSAMLGSDAGALGAAFIARGGQRISSEHDQ